MIKILFIFYSFAFSATSNYKETFWDRLMNEQSHFDIQKGISLMQDKNYSLASIEFSKAIDKSPSALAYAMYGASLYWMRDIEGSIEQYNKAINLDPKSAISYQLRGISYARMQETDKALDDFFQSLKYEPTRADVNMNIGSIYFSKGYMDKALFYLRQAVKYDPNNPLFSYQLGMAYYYIERYQDALKCFEKGFSLFPYYEEAILWAGLTEEKLNNDKQALKYFLKAISIKNNDFFARYKAAFLLNKFSKNKEALNQVEKSLVLRKENDEGGLSFSVTYGKNFNTNNEKSKTNIPESIKTNSLKQIYEDLINVDPSQNIDFSLDILINEKFKLQEQRKDVLKNALTFSNLKNKYITRSFSLPSSNIEKRKEIIAKYLTETENLLPKDKENYDFRINFSMKTSKPVNQKENNIVYSPRDVGNDMGLWIYGNNWLNILEEDISSNNDENETEEQNLISGLAYLLYGDGEKALEKFNLAKKYTILSNLGKAASEICLGNQEQALIFLKNVLEVDPKNKIAKENLKTIEKKQ